MTTMRHSDHTWAALLLAAVIGPICALVTGDSFLLMTFERVLIFAVAAASLNLILGYGGMVSFGHAVFLGVGSYTTGILANAGLTNIAIQIPAVIVVSALVAAFIGAISLRTAGIYFIMITLALAQIFFYLAISSSRFGGDDGMTIYERTTVFPFYDAYDAWQFYLFVAVSSVLLIGLVNRAIASEFGQRLIACRENPRRAEAIGFNVYGTRLAAFVLAGAVCGLAGHLLANQSEFATPNFSTWRTSGELLAIVIFGGAGMRNGPVVGAFAFILIQDFLSDLTTHWAAIFGPLLILAVLFSSGGLVGEVERLRARLRKRWA